MAKKLSVFNFLSVLLAIAVNYYAQAVELNGNTIGSLSAEYQNLFTPAGYAFSIWAVIYIALLAYAGFQIYCAFKTEKHTDLIAKTGAWFILANIGNTAWVFAWLYELTGLSVLIMLFILFSLIKIILNTNMERWDAPLKVIVFSWWPICFYSGWIAVATIANISAYLAKIGWDGWFFSEIQWAATMVVVATIINVLMIYTRNMREFGIVGVWALVAIFVRHSGENDTLAWIAMGGAILIFLNASYHGYKNKETSPMAKIKDS